MSDTRWALVPACFFIYIAMQFIRNRTYHEANGGVGKQSVNTHGRANGQRQVGQHSHKEVRDDAGCCCR